MTRKEFITVVKSTIHEYKRDDVGLLAAGVALFVFISLFPALLLAATLAGLYMDPLDAMEFIYTTVAQYAPGSTKLLQDVLNEATSNRANAGWLALAGIVTLAYSASNAFGTLDKAINRAWGAEKVPGFIVGKLASFVMMVIAAVLLLLSVLASTALTAVRAAAKYTFGEVPGDSIIWWLANIALSLALIFLIFLLLYWLVPRFEVVFRDVWLGALLAAVAWVILKELFALYLGSSLVDFNATYGSIGTVVILLLWIYMSTLIILTGAEFTSETYRVRRLRAEIALAQHPELEETRESPWFSGA